MSGLQTSIAFAPLVPWPLLAALGLVAAVPIAAGAALRSRGAGWRLAAAVALWLALVNPALVVEQRDPLPDVAVVVVDDSPSQNIGQRPARAEAALEHLRGAVARLPDLELRVVRAGGARAAEDGTRLFAPLRRALSEVPPGRLAGILMITDGQVHDAPPPSRWPPRAGPFHLLVTGDRDERDRRLVIAQAPAYGLIGKRLAMMVRVEDLPERRARQARIVIERDGEPWRTVVVPVGEERRIEFELDRAGQTYFELRVDPLPGELTRQNNRAVVAVNGVRDRLRVLLVSGEPHPGERSWRNLLKSDPAVDLVHFTILRPPEKQDFTPVRELSLISFPVRELFSAKLDEFDLIIFDRYRRRGVILSTYLTNIADYVRKGGALLVAVGPSFAGPLSLYRTGLEPVLPGAPTGATLVRRFRARVSAPGRRHPVTADLPGAGTAGAGTAGAETAGAETNEPRWGHWFRQIEVAAARGNALMTGIDGKPLLVLDRVGKGRVAQLLSDQIWLWGRGYDGGGPQAELVRRLAHWLMKEPELEENMRSAESHGGRLEIVRRSLEPTSRPVTLTLPSGETRQVALEEGAGGRASAGIAIEGPGLYRLSDGERKALTAAGTANPREAADARASAERLAPLAARTGGGVLWLAEQPRPELRRVRPGRDMAGRGRSAGGGWLGLRANGDFIVTGIREVPLLPGLLMLVLALGAAALAWRVEAK